MKPSYPAFETDNNPQLIHIKDLSVGRRVLDICGNFGTIIKKSENSVVVRQASGATVTFQNVALVKPFEIVTCDKCSGEGEHNIEIGFTQECEDCNGTGEVQKWLFS